METETTTDLYGDEITYSIPVEAGDVTDEILDLMIETVDGWFPDGPIDWENVWDRAEGTELSDGTLLGWGSEYDTAAMRKVQREVRKIRASG